MPWLRRRSTGASQLCLGLLVLVAFGPIVAGDNAQPASRYSLTAALAEHHTVDLGRYARDLGVDRAIYRGHLRSDKAPGQPLLAVPVYLVGRALGAQPATHVHVNGDLGLWWETLWSATIPLAVLLATDVPAVRAVHAAKCRARRHAGVRHRHDASPVRREPLRARPRGAVRVRRGW